MTRLFAAPGMTSQHRVAERTSRVIGKVIFDMGAERLLHGTIQLDWRLRPCFHGCEVGNGRPPLASVALSGLSETAALCAAARAPAGESTLDPYTAAVVAALVREFRAQSPRFRGLP